jgi:hypothetical protein
MNNPNINKNLYKLFLSIVKYTPTFLSFVFIVNLTCIYFKITIPVLAYLGGVSFIFILILYLVSWVFKFCHLFRIPLHYVTLVNTIGIIDKYIILPFSTIGMYRLYFIISGIMLVISIWLMYKNRNNPKVDPIKQLCAT